MRSVLKKKIPLQNLLPLLLFAVGVHGAPDRLPLCIPGRLIGGTHGKLRIDEGHNTIYDPLPAAPSPLAACIAYLTAGVEYTFQFQHPDSGGVTFPLLSVPPIPGGTGGDSIGSSFPSMFSAEGTARTGIDFPALDPGRFDAKDITTGPLFVENARANETTAAGNPLAPANDSSMFLVGPEQSELEGAGSITMLPITPLWRECGSGFVAGQRMTVTVSPKVSTVAMLSLGAAFEGLGCYDACIFETRRQCGNGGGIAVVFIFMIMAVFFISLPLWGSARSIGAAVTITLPRAQRWAVAIIAMLSSTVPLATGFLRIYHISTGDDGKLDLLVPSQPVYHALTSSVAIGSAAVLVACVARAARGKSGSNPPESPSPMLAGAFFPLNATVAGLGVAMAYFDREYTSWWYTSDASHVMSFFLPAFHLVAVVALLATVAIRAHRAGARVGSKTDVVEMTIAGGHA